MSVVDLLRTRKTLILEKPLINMVGGLFGYRYHYQALPPGVTEEQAVEVVKEAWGKKLASGIADRAGLTGTARNTFIENWGTVVSEGLLKGTTVTPLTAAPAETVRRRTR